MNSIRGKELKWFESYLSNTRTTQRTKVISAVSDCLEVDIGVAQRSLLGALLFIIYINDTSKCR